MDCAHMQAPCPPNAADDPNCVDQMNCGSDTIDREERTRRALSIIGAFSCGVDDLAVNHDRYLAEAYADSAAEE